MAKKHKIIIIQEEISGREIVEVKFMGEKIKAETEMMNLRREIWGLNFKGEKIWDFKIGETLKRSKREKNGTVKWERHV